MKKTYFRYKESRYGGMNEIEFKSGFKLPFWMFWYISACGVLVGLGLVYENIKRFVPSESASIVCASLFIGLIYVVVKILKISCIFASKELKDAMAQKIRIEKRCHRMNQRNMQFEIIKDGDWYMIYETKKLKKLESKSATGVFQRVEYDLKVMSKVDDYNELFAALQKDCDEENVLNAFSYISLAELIELNCLLDRLIVFCESVDQEELEDCECGDKVLKLYQLADTLFTRSSRNED